jgi:hypothetical protein
MLRLEKAYLLTDVQFNRAEESMYDSTKGDINNREVNVTFNCFPITGYMVDKAARALLQDITGVNVTADVSGVPTYKVEKTENVAVLDSADYRWGIMDSNSDGKIQSLVDATAVEYNGMLGKDNHYSYTGNSTQSS